MAAAITDLPEEILARILAPIDDDDDRQSTLSACALTSKQFNRLATPLLYQDVQFDDPNAHGMVAFLHLMLTSPRHAQLVKYLAVPEGEIEEKWTDPDGLEQAVEDNLRNTMPTEALRRKWKVRLLSQAEPFLLVLFVTLCLPNLQNLCFNASYCREECWDPILELLNAFDLSSSRPCFWPKVQEVFYQGLGEKTNKSQPLAVFARMPWLKSLKGFALGDGAAGDEHPDQPDGAYIDLPIRTSSLESIALPYSSKIRDENLYKLLQVPKALRSFEYEVGRAWAWCDCTLGGIQRALDLQHETLEEITLRIVYYHEFDGPVQSMNFSQYTSLRCLTIADEFIFNSQDGYSLALMIPSSIEVLKLLLMRKELSEGLLNPALVELLNEYEDKFARLNGLEVHVAEKTLAEIILLEIRGTFMRARALDIQAVVVIKEEWSDSSGEGFGIRAQANTEQAEDVVIDFREYHSME